MTVWCGQIETKRGENVRLEASVKRLDKQIRAKEDELQGKTAQLNTCRQQTARAQVGPLPCAALTAAVAWQPSASICRGNQRHPPEPVRARRVGARLDQSQCSERCREAVNGHRRSQSQAWRIQGNTERAESGTHNDIVMIARRSAHASVSYHSLQIARLPLDPAVAPGSSLQI